MSGRGGSCGALRPTPRSRVEGVWTLIGIVGPRHRVSGRPLQAALETSPDGSPSPSRHSTQDGESFRPSPGHPRGGGIADRCAGVRPKWIAAGVAPPRTCCSRSKGEGWFGNCRGSYRARAQETREVTETGGLPGPRSVRSSQFWLGKRFAQPTGSGSQLDSSER